MPRGNEWDCVDQLQGQRNDCATKTAIGEERLEVTRKCKASHYCDIHKEQLVVFRLVRILIGDCWRDEVHRVVSRWKRRRRRRQKGR